MRSLLSLVLLSVTLSSPFGEAQARAVEAGPDGMTIEVEVEVDQSALVVLVRGASRLEELAPVALVELSPGRWAGIVEIAIVEDILVGFELIRPDGGSAIVSELHRLSELGVDPAVFAAAQPTTTSTAGTGVPTVTDPGPSTAPIWLAVAAGAAALALLLVWWLGDRPDGDDAADGDSGEPDVDGDGPAVDEDAGSIDVPDGGR